MTTIVTVDSNYFSIDGAPFARIFIPLAQGSNAVSIVGILDSRLKAMNSTAYTDLTIDGVTPSSQSDAMEKIYAVCFVNSFKEITNYIYSPSGDVVAQGTDDGFVVGSDLRTGYINLNRGVTVSTEGNAIDLQMGGSHDGFYYYELLVSNSALNTYKVSGYARLTTGDLFTSGSKVVNAMTNSAYSSYDINVSDPYNEDGVAKVRIALTNLGDSFTVQAKVWGIVTGSNMLDNVSFSDPYTHGLTLEGMIQNYVEKRISARVTLAGVVASDSASPSNADISVQKDGTGQYTVTFGDVTTVKTAQVTVHDTGTTAATTYIAKAYQISGNEVPVAIYSITAGALADQSFSIDITY